MKISIDEFKSILIEEVFNSIVFKTRYGEELSLCMRDTGYEFHYNDEWYEAKNGVIKKMKVMRKEDKEESIDENINSVKDVEGALRNVLEITPIENKASTETKVNNVRTVTSSKTEGEVILKYSPKNPEIFKTKTD